MYQRNTEMFTHKYGTHRHITMKISSLYTHIESNFLMQEYSQPLCIGFALAGFRGVLLHLFSFRSTCAFIYAS